MTEPNDVPENELQAAFELVLALAARNMLETDTADAAFVDGVLRQQDAIDKVGACLDDMLVLRKQFAELEAASDDAAVLDDHNLAASHSIEVTRLRATLQAIKETCVEYQRPEEPEDVADDDKTRYRFCAECSFVADEKWKLPSCPCERAAIALYK